MFHVEGMHVIKHDQVRPPIWGEAALLLASFCSEYLVGDPLPPLSPSLFLQQDAQHQLLHVLSRQMAKAAHQGLHMSLVYAMLLDRTSICNSFHNRKHLDKSTAG